MNYAALLAIMVLLAFTFPMAVRLGEALGLSAGVAAVTVWMGVVFAVAVRFVRWRVARASWGSGQIEQGRRQVLERPNDPAAYYVDGQHVALALLKRGRRREAEELVDRFARLGGAKDGDILALREALSSANRWRFQRQVPPRPPVRELQAAQLEAAQQTSQGTPRVTNQPEELQSGDAATKAACEDRRIDNWSTEQSAGGRV